MPNSVVVTKYKTEVEKVPVPYTTKRPSQSVITDYKKVPVTSTYVETKTCKGGYGGGY